MITGDSYDGQAGVVYKLQVRKKVSGECRQTWRGNASARMIPRSMFWPGYH